MNQANSVIQMESDVEVSSSNGMKMKLAKISNYDSPIVVSFGDKSEKAVKLDIHYVRDEAKFGGPSGHYSMTVD